RGASRTGGWGSECRRKCATASGLVSDLIAEISSAAAIAHDVTRRVELDFVAGEHVGDRRNAVELDHRDGKMPAAVGFCESRHAVDAVAGKDTELFLRTSDQLDRAPWRVRLLLVLRRPWCGRGGSQPGAACRLGAGGKGRAGGGLSPPSPPGCPSTAAATPPRGPRSP